MKQIVEPMVGSIESYEQEMVIDSCEQAMISLLIVKRFTEHKFPATLDQLDYLDIKNTIDTTQFQDSEKERFEHNIEHVTNEWVLPWIEDCKRNFDTVTMHPYSVDSLKLDWTKISDLENSTRKIVKESWMLKVKPDSIIEPYFIDLEIELIDSTGRVLSKLTGIAK